jgi:secreted trypsin-like serine protease
MAAHSRFVWLAFALGVLVTGPFGVASPPAYAQASEEDAPQETDAEPAENGAPPADDAEQVADADQTDDGSGEFLAVFDPEEDGPDEVEPGEGGSEGTNGLEPDEDPTGIREPPAIPLVTASAPSQTPSVGMQPRSLGGERVLDGAAPWQAQIYGPFPATRFSAAFRQGKQLWELQHYCGGALVAPDWVLTAAHCIDQDMVKAGYRVRLGQEDISRPGGVTYRIDRFVHAPGYTPTYVGDLALVHIVADQPQSARDPSQIREIPLLRGGAPGDGAPVMGFGWGRTSDAGANASAVLMRVPLNIIAQPRCAAMPDKGPQKIHANVVCAAAPGRKTCRGDSGGPLVAGGRLVGVVSWGSERCANDSQPGVYTRVGSYAEWIDRVTGGTAR